MSAWKHPPRPSRESQAHRICKMALWFLIFFAALVTAIALAPDLSAWAEGLTIHPDCPTRAC
ncbi:hypothetical protein [Sulfitobacter mediterraneus]|uniref:hypothetical protein n=1 Tax=Sulfitobacter mediterraneus TaxID=83219 RepID=UPI0019399218|nr:hypothetical protein [Sulfitobacter mediterraneus]MBM1625279.1 hypothetical protein [Sulfitobacter mediterraneus]